LDEIAQVGCSKVGDHEEASLRLRRLAAVYEPETRGLLEVVRNSDQLHAHRLAVDLGCGPGWTTQLLDAVLKPQRTVGLDSSERYIAEARINCPTLEFIRHDILQTPFPVESPDLFLCRFLLTHLPSPQTALRIWANAAAAQATLLIHETEWLESTHPALRRYYELVEKMQRHYGQELNVGATLDVSIAGRVGKYSIAGAWFWKSLHGKWRGYICPICAPGAATNSLHRHSIVASWMSWMQLLIQ
jgi:trans-aconitate 2-methyltransferase